MTSITAMLRKQSAKLKTGKFQIAIKSLTPPSKTLSIRFPKVPAKNKIKVQFLSSFFFHKKKKSQIPSIESHKTSGRYTCNPREIPVLKTGCKNQSVSPIFKS